MDYTTDVTEAVRTALVGRHEEAQQVLANYRLAATTRQFCRELRELDGKGPDLELAKVEADNATTSDKLELELILVSSELGDEAPPVVTRIRANALRDYLSAVERQHAIHETFARLADASRNPEEAERQTIEALVLEGTHAAVLTELELLRPLEEAELAAIAEATALEYQAAAEAIEAERATEVKAQEEIARAEEVLEAEGRERERIELEAARQVEDPVDAREEAAS